MIWEEYVVPGFGEPRFVENLGRAGWLRIRGRNAVSGFEEDRMVEDLERTGWLRI